VARGTFWTTAATAEVARSGTIEAKYRMVVGLSVDFVDMSDLVFLKAIRPYIPSFIYPFPSNPLLHHIGINSRNPKLMLHSVRLFYYETRTVSVSTVISAHCQERRRNLAK
jgi:hypothetical protein